MTNLDNFKFMMLSAGFEHGGNTTHRFLDGHPELYVYPFESQLGNHLFTDHLSGLHPFRYRYPEFPIGATASELYELFFDEEMKVRLRVPNVSKFRNADLQLDEKKRKAVFGELLAQNPMTRRNIVAAFFVATFEAWTNYARSGNNHVYVGYCPAINIDAERLLADFPDGHIVHVVRNPYSAYADTKRRSFPHHLSRYIATWNILHTLALSYEQRFPNNFHVVRFESVIADPKATLGAVCDQLGIAWSDTLLYPSWNSVKLDGLPPWGAVRKPTPEYNLSVINELTEAERHEIKQLSNRLLMQHFEYDTLG